MYLGDYLHHKDRYIDGSETWKPLLLNNKDRFRHVYASGQTGVGKSTFIVRVALDDIAKGEGVMVFDPHGDLIEDILLRIPPERRDDVVLFDASDREYSPSFNPFADIPKELRANVADSLVDAMKSVTGYSDVNTSVLDRVLGNGARIVLDTPTGSFIDLYYLLINSDHRKALLRHCKDEVIRTFWRREIGDMIPKEQRQYFQSTLNNFDQFVTDPTFRHIFGQHHSKIDLSEIMDKSKILLVKLPIGHLGHKKASMIGALILSLLHSTAIRRKNRKPFHLFIDEFSYFGSLTVQQMLSGIRKYGVSLTILQQYSAQVGEDMLSAIWGNVGTLMSFRAGLEDEALLKSQFNLEPKDKLSELDPFTAFVRTTDTHFLKLPDISKVTQSGQADYIRRRSRELYCRDSEQVRLALNAYIRKMP